MKKKNALMLSILLLLVAVTGGMVSLTYSRYSSSASGTSTAKVAPWKISVNGDNVVETSTFTASDITWSASDYISDGYIAPSRSGSFDIEIDPSGSKVAVQYEISLDTTSMDQYSQISISSVKIGNETLTATNGKYVGIIDLSEVEANTTKTITVNVVWTNADANNASDTTIGSTVTNLAIPVTVTASQYLG